MSKKSGGSKSRHLEPAGKTRRGDESQQPTPVTSRPPFKPRPLLFYGLLTGFALWVGVLLGLYFFTVYPTRHTHAKPAADAPTAGTVAR